MKNALIAVPFGFLWLWLSCGEKTPDYGPEDAFVIEQANQYLTAPVQTVTAAVCPRSAGGIHDFYSEGDYWWPDSLDPDGPYVRRDGMSNPDNFSAHRHAMVRLSQIMGSLAEAYLITGDERYVQQAMVHVNAWFVDPETLMNPHMLYAQAIKGRVTGRGIGLIDAIHLAEVARSIKVMQGAGAVDPQLLQEAKAWFGTFADWCRTHPYGQDEMNTRNNHATCWVMTVSSLADLLEDEALLDFCRERFKNVLLPDQMAVDGSFPLELERTKPYGYSLFNLDAMATIAQILSTPADDLWTYTTPDGKSLRQGLAFLEPYIHDKSRWPYGEDVLYWNDWPVRQPALFFGGHAYDRSDYLELFYRLERDPQQAEVLRNLPIRHPRIWVN